MSSSGHRSTRRNLGSTQEEAAPERGDAVQGLRDVSVSIPGRATAYVRHAGDFVAARTLSNTTDAAKRRVDARLQQARHLAKRSAAHNDKIVNARVMRARRALDRLLTGDSQLWERWTKHQQHDQAAWREHSEALAASMQRGDRRRLWQGATLLGALPLFAIYGRQNVQHNLTLTVLALVWLFGDEMTDVLSGTTDAAESSAQRSEWWGYVAPIANLMAGWWLLHERQHEPLISGVAAHFEPTGSLGVAAAAPATTARAPAPGVAAASSGGQVGRTKVRSRVRRTLEAARTVLAPCFDDDSVPPGRKRSLEQYVCKVDLAPYVASGFRLDLIAAGALPALATLGDVTWAPSGKATLPRVEGLHAHVELGQLILTLTVSGNIAAGRATPLLAAASAAWVVQVLDEAALGF